MINKQDYLDSMEVNGKKYSFYNINRFADKGHNIKRLPKSIKILLEGSLRNFDNQLINESHIEQLLGFGMTEEIREVGFIPTRIILQDFTGVPAVVDLAAMREAAKNMGKDPTLINPKVPVDLVIDHSIMVDDYGNSNSLFVNTSKEFERNEERYRFLKWAQHSFKNFNIVPPSTGIIHQINLEYLASVVSQADENGRTFLFPDSIVGTDSHTTMINGIGVLGWGVGGIEAEAGMLGQPIYFVTPDVVGVKLSGKLSEGTTATDLALSVTKILRSQNVVGKFVEFYGEGVKSLALPDRATVANMAPEYGATMGYFPVDDETLNYLKITGREDEQIQIVKDYLVKQGLFDVHTGDEIDYSSVVEIDLGQISASLAGPKRPQDKILLEDMQEAFHSIVTESVEKGGYGLTEDEFKKEVVLDNFNTEGQMILKTGAVVIAAITSCTNTSNPTVMIGAGLMAKKAVELGLQTPDYVKTSLTPGSRVVEEYLKLAGVEDSLEKLGFNIVGYGCATCIGNSGPLKKPIADAIDDKDLLVASVLSGNRNFEGRVHQRVKANYLASPMLVVAYALAGTVDINFKEEALGLSDKGTKVYLSDIWPSNEDIKKVVETSVQQDMFVERYKEVYSKNDMWNAIDVPKGMLYEWQEESTYIRQPDFFDQLEKKECAENIIDSRVLLYLGDSITTDHISPAGGISKNSPAAQYLKVHGVKEEAYNSYGSRRGNHEVMMRGTFANIRIHNELALGKEGGYTTHFSNTDVKPVYDIAMEYKQQQVPLIILAGKEYGTGSSRDWAAKGTTMLGVKAVIAESYERIHRSNLVGMGVLPIQFLSQDSAKSLGLTGKESFNITGLDQELQPLMHVNIEAKSGQGELTRFEAIVRLDSDVEIDYYLKGGILSKVMIDL